MSPGGFPTPPQVLLLGERRGHELGIVDVPTAVGVQVLHLNRVHSRTRSTEPARVGARARAPRDKGCGVWEQPWGTEVPGAQ